MIMNPGDLKKKKIVSRFSTLESALNLFGKWGECPKNFYKSCGKNF